MLFVGCFPLFLNDRVSKFIWIPQQYAEQFAKNGASSYYAAQLDLKKWFNKYLILVINKQQTKWVLESILRWLVCTRFSCAGVIDSIYQLNMGDWLEMDKTSKQKVALGLLLTLLSISFICE